MSKFKINANFRGHKKGDVLPEWEYKKLPHEIKLHCKEIIDEPKKLEPVIKPEQVLEIIDTVNRFKKKDVTE